MTGASIVEPQSIVGELSATSARACGLVAGVPVVAGCGDTAASLLACGAVKPGVCVDVAGTASVFAATTRAFVPDVQRGMLSCARSVTPGLWHPYAYVNGGGMNLEWFRKLAAGVGPRGAAARDPVDLSTLDRLVVAIPLTEDLPIFVPHLAGRNSPPQTSLRGAWTGLTHDHGVAALYRAVLEGVALEYALYAAAINELSPSAPLRELRVTGGGAASGTWNAIKADVLQIPVRPVTQSQGAAAGAAIIAGWGTGVFSSPEAAARRWVSLGAAVRPRRSAAAVVKRRLARYQSLLHSLDPHATMPARAASTQETT
ncbi:MAG: FGGY-family carbohydrate kinase [Planctomycetota bacterium]